MVDATSTLECVEVKCPDCSKDWGHSYCGTCAGKGFIMKPQSPAEQGEKKLPMKSIRKLREMLASLGIEHNDQLSIVAFALRLWDEVSQTAIESPTPQPGQEVLVKMRIARIEGKRVDLDYDSISSAGVRGKSVVSSVHLDSIRPTAEGQGG